MYVKYVMVINFLNCFYTKVTIFNNKMSELQVNFHYRGFSSLSFQHGDRVKALIGS